MSSVLAYGMQPIKACGRSWRTYPEFPDETSLMHAEGCRLRTKTGLWQSLNLTLLTILGKEASYASEIGSLWYYS